MSISVGDVLMKMGIDTGDFDSALKGIQNQTKQTMDQMQSDLKAGAIAWTGLGAAITGALGVSVFAAESARESQARLAQSMANTGVSYNSVSGQIDALIKKEMSLTSYSNIDMYNALNRLVIITGNYSDAMQALPGVLDLAAAGNIDVVTAARMAGDAYDGFSTRLKTMYGIDIPKGLTGMAALEYVFKRVKDAAEATANPFTQFKNTIVLLSQDIGGVLLPTLTNIIKNIEAFVSGTMAWLDKYPAFKDALVVIAVVSGAAATAIGLTSLAITAQLIPRLIAGATALWSYISALYAQVAAQLMVYVAMGPAGWAILAGMAAAVVYAGYVVDKLAHSFFSAGKASTDAATSVSDAMNEITSSTTGMETPASISIANITWGLQQMGDTADEINRKLQDLGYTISTMPSPDTSPPSPSSPPSGSWWQRLLGLLTGNPLLTYDTGGLITEPTLLMRMRDMQPYAVAAKNGVPETIGPAGANGGNLTINIAQLHVREEADISRIAKQLYYLQKTKSRVLGVA